MMVSYATFIKQMYLSVFYCFILNVLLGFSLYKDELIDLDEYLPAVNFAGIQVISLSLFAFFVFCSISQSQIEFTQLEQEVEEEPETNCSWIRLFLQIAYFCLVIVFCAAIGNVTSFLAVCAANDYNCYSKGWFFSAFVVVTLVTLCISLSAVMCNFYQVIGFFKEYYLCTKYKTRRNLITVNDSLHLVY